MLKKSIFFALVILLLSALIVGCQQTESTETAEEEPAKAVNTEENNVEETNDDQANEEQTPVTSGDGPVAVIETAKGNIVFELYPDVAPNTVANFIKLTNQGFYNGLKFHRVVPRFVIQGGDPNGDGTGGPGYSIDAEFNEKKHVTGTVAMARSANINSAGSQFYICLEPQPALDNQYTIFGQVTQGLDVIQKIEKDDVMTKVFMEKE